ncbi:MAG: InlB B-repeat-containing protein, partial [Bacteroidales bacterium]|nr:InlB B-repeat-containing protein [Bacteroidales bacterium]
SSVSKVRFLHGATGSNRGWGLYAKGEGDADWVLISDAVASNAKGTEVVAEVNKTNCQLRFYNLNTSQNAYMFELEIQGLVDMSQMPALGTFEVNGVAVEAVDIFEIDAEGNYAATYEISKTAKMISAENPLTNIVAANGSVGEVTYQLNATADTCVCTIPVSLTAGEKEIVANYILTVILKPDFTVTYYDVDGTTVLATQTVEKDAAVAAFAADASKVTVAEGHVFRGWFVAATGEDVRKYTVDEIIVGNTAFYARTTPEEVAVAGTRYAYALNHQYFDAADHESFSSNGSFHDTQHGWDFAAGESITLKVGGNAFIILGCCKYSANGAVAVTNAAGETIGEIADAYVETDGATVSFTYEGPATELTFTFSATTYIHSVIINNVGEAGITKNEAGYYVIQAGNVSQFLSVLEIAQASKAADERAYIFLPNGLYDMGEAVLTPIASNNISIIGESMEKTIIRNAPDKSVEGIGTTATFLITGKNTYFQDLTIQNALDYYGAGSAGRAVCLQDRGANTICKNVRLLS